MEKTVVGAKKRKMYKQNKAAESQPTPRTSKESTPADRYAFRSAECSNFNWKLLFSGFIETIDLANSDRSETPTLKKQDYDILDEILKELNVIKPKETAKKAGSSRRTARQAAILKQQSPTKLLQRTVVKKKLAKSTVTTEEVVNHFLPQVSILKLSNEQTKDLSRPWGFLDKNKVEDKYKFHATVTKRRKSRATGAVEVLVKWSPPGILENTWMKSSELPDNGVKVVDVQNLSWRQKLLIGGHIPKSH